MRQEDYQAVTDEELDGLMDSAEVAAAADNNMRVERDEPKTEEQIAKEAEEETEEDVYEVPLSREYAIGSEKISKIDMSGLEKLTTRDGEYVDRVLAKLGHNPGNKFKDTTYCKFIAMRATGLPLDFFNGLDLRDMTLVEAKVYFYFLYSSR